MLAACSTRVSSSSPLRRRQAITGRASGSAPQGEGTRWARTTTLSPHAVTLWATAVEVTAIAQAAAADLVSFASPCVGPLVSASAGFLTRRSSRGGGSWADGGAERSLSRARPVASQREHPGCVYVVGRLMEGSNELAAVWRLFGERQRPLMANPLHDPRYGRVRSPQPLMSEALDDELHGLWAVCLAALVAPLAGRPFDVCVQHRALDIYFRSP